MYTLHKMSSYEKKRGHLCWEIISVNKAKIEEKKLSAEIFFLICKRREKHTQNVVGVVYPLTGCEWYFENIVGFYIF